MSHFQSIESYGFLKPIKDNYKNILQEYLSINNKTQDWFETDLYKGKWKTFGFIFKNEDDVESQKLCPFTFSLIKNVPNVYIAGFSVMEPKTIIYPHIGYNNNVLRSHLGLICPSGPYIKVGGEVKHWSEGEMFVFDDTIEHEAENPSDYQRVILILDFYK